MKKIFSIVLILAMALCLFSACNGDENTTLKAAQEYLDAICESWNGTEAIRAFNVVNVVKIDGVSFNVSWTTDSEHVTLSPTADNKYISVSFEELPEAYSFTLTATISDANGDTLTSTFTRLIPAKKASGTVIADKPEDGNAYKLTVAQNEATVKKTLYFTGEMSGYYLATTENPFEAVDVTVEAVEGGYHLYFTKDGAKTYIDIVPRADAEGKVNVKLVDAPTCVYTWNETYKTFVTHVVEKDWYLGCYNTYTTISPSETSYITDANVDISQFPARLATVSIVPEDAATPDKDSVYKLHVAQNEATVKKNLYFTGKMSGYYLATTTNPAEAVNIHIEAVDGGYHLYFLNGEAKTYIDIVPRTDAEDKVNVKLVDAPTCVYTWNANYKTFVTHVVGKDWYLGCYNTYTTISPSETSYITDANVDISQFPARLATVDGFMNEVTIEPDEPDEPVVKPSEGGAPVEGTAYKFSMEQVTLKKTLYFNGKMASSGAFLATTENPDEAVEIYVEKVTGGYRMYFMDGETKTYIDTVERDGTKSSPKLTTEPTATYVWDETYGIFTCKLKENTFYFGTYASYDTISTSSTYFISQSGQCIAYLVKSSDIAAHEHAEEVIPAKEATCSETGLTEGKKCSACGEIIVKQEEVARKPHTEEAIPGKEATCLADGLTEGKKCSVCGEITVKQETIGAKGHAYVDTVTAPTCEAGGYTTSVCSACGDKKITNEVPALGHKDDNDDGKCDNCDESMSDLCDHAYGEEVTAPTCTEQGYTTHTCSKCGNSYKDTYTDATGHVETEIRDDKAATCTEAGYTGDKYCKACDAKIEDGAQISTLGHGETELKNAVEASCTAKGYTGDTYCKVCNQKIADGEEIAMAEHSWNEGTVTTEPTADAEGVKTYTCTVCGNTKEEAIPSKSDKVVISNNGKYVTDEEYSYTNKNGVTKIELVLSSNVANAVKLAVRNNADGTVSYVTDSGKYLFANGTDVKFVAEESEHTKFYLEQTDGGYFVKCATATYTNSEGETFAQYLEVYNGYLTVYSKYATSDSSIYTFTIAAPEEGGNEGGDDGNEGGEIEAPTGTSITYDFKDLQVAQTGNYNAMTDDEIKAAFMAAASDTGLIKVSGTKIFAGNNGTSGPYPQENGYLKTGSSSAKGQLILEYAEGTQVAKVEIYCHAWKAGDKVSVNGSSEQEASNSACECLTFELSELTDTVQIDFNKRVLISKIVITFA